MTTLSSQMVRTRKEHRCWGCAREFPVYSEMHSVASVDMGKAHTTYWCKTCTQYWDKYCQYDDEISYGDLRSEDTQEWEKIRLSIEEVV